MTDRTAENILARRRVQNREAQRRFREKKTVQRTLELLQLTGHSYRTPDSLTQSAPLADSPLSFPSCSLGDIPGTAGCWDLETSDPLIVEDNSLLEYNDLSGDTVSHMPTFMTQESSTAPFSSADIDRGISTLHFSVGASVDYLPSTAETSLSPGNASIELLDETLLNPSSASSTKSSGGWASPLHIAAKRGSSRIIRMLLQHSSDCNELDSEGLTPLMHAVIGGHEEATLSLLEYGAVIENDQQDGEEPRPSAIHWAILKRREGVLRVLLDNCSNTELMNSYDDLGRAPLHIAIDNDFDAGVSLLLQFGADPSLKVQQY
ncbi:ankyrin repeat-containing domain protein [Hypoxylon sp. FL1284]|nr:ankyrin repeat-containing domain protein [Hypoxylon sp. FL1284]